MEEMSDPIAIINEALRWYLCTTPQSEYGTSAINELCTAINEGYYYQDDRHLRIDFGD